MLWSATRRLLGAYRSTTPTKAPRLRCGLVKLALGYGISSMILLLGAVPAHAQQADSTVQLPPIAVQGTKPSRPAPVATSGGNAVPAENPNQPTPAATSAANAAQAPYQAGKADLGPLGTQPIQDVPQSVTSIPEALIVNQEAQTVNDTLRYLPSVEIRDQQGLEVSRPQSRGFQGSVVENTRLDGLNIIGTTAIPAENLAGVQVLNGLGSSLYGPETSAGVFNYILKAPTDATFFHYFESFNSQSIFTEQIDAGGRLGQDHEIGYRINLVHGQGEEYVDQSSTNRTLGSIDLDYRLDKQTDIEAYYGHYATDVTGLPGSIVYFSGKSTILPPAPNPTIVGIGQPGAGTDLISDTGLVKIKHSFNSDWNFEIGGLYENAIRNLWGITDQMTDNNGDYKTTKNFNAVPRFTIGSNTAYLNGHFDFLGTKNDLTIGTNGFINGQYSYYNSIATVLGSASLANPVVFPTQPIPNGGGQYRSGSLFQQAIITGDTIHFNQQLALQGVLSTSFIDTRSFSGTGAVTSAYTADGVPSPTVSLIYKPVPKLTTYATYAQGVEPGDTAPAGTANVNEILAPYHDQAYEVGAKYAVNDDFLVTLAGFRMTKPLALTDATTNIFQVVGTQRNYGVELFAQGKVTPDLSVLGGVTYIDARLVGTEEVATNDMLVVGVPHYKSDVVVDYHPKFAHGFALTGAVHYESARAATNTNTSFAPPYATLDLGARYATAYFGHNATWRFQVINVTNTFYYSSIADGNIVGSAGANTAYLGAPRTYRGSLEIDF